MANFLLRSLTLTVASLVGSSALAAGTQLAPPLEGRMIVPGVPANVAANGDRFLALWPSEGSQAMVTSIDPAGTRAHTAVGVRSGCGTLLPFESGYVVSCYTNRESSIRILDADGIEIGQVPPTSSAGYRRALAANGGRLLIASAEDMREVRIIDAYSGAQHGATIALPEGSFDTVAERTASGFVLVSPARHEFGLKRNVRVLALSLDGSIRYETSFSSQYLNRDIVVGVLGDDVLVFWSDIRAYGYTAAISAQGVVTIREGVTTGIDGVRLVARGDSLLLVGRRPHGHSTPGVGVVVFFARDGTRLNYLDIASPLTVVAAAANDSVVYLLATRWNGVSHEVVGLSIPANSLGSPPREEIVSVGALSQDGVAAATTFGGVVVAWRERAADRTTIRARRLTDGQPVGQPVDVFTTAARTSTARVAATATTTLVVWIDDSGIRARRLDASLRSLDETPLLISGRTAYPYSALSVASDQSDFVVAWVENHRDHQTIGAAAVSAAGAVAPGRTLVVGAAATGGGSYHRYDFRHALSVTWAGDRYVLLWAHEQQSSAPFGTIVERRDLRMVAVSRNASSMLLPETSLAADLTQPRVAAGSGAVAILAEQPYSGTQFLLIADLVSGKQLARSELGRAVTREDRADGAVAWSGRDFILAWRDAARSYLTRFVVGGQAQNSFITNHPLETSLVVTSTGRVEYIAVERPAAGRNASPRAFVYQESDFTPVTEPPRSRAVRR